MKKKILVLLLAFAVVFSFVGCGSDDDVINDGTNTTNEEKDLGDSSSLNEGDSVKDSAEDAADSIKDGVEDTGDAVKKGVDDIVDKDKTNE